MTTTTRSRVVAITGGARGIGFHTAQELIRCGHQVAIGDIDEIKLKSSAEDLGVEVAVRLDVTDPKSISAFLDATEDALGPIDVLINNAGVMPTGHVHQEPDEVTRRQVEINVLGVIFGTKLALQRMLPRRRGAYHQHGLAGRRAAGAGSGDLLRHQVRRHRVHRGGTVGVSEVGCQAVHGAAHLHHTELVSGTSGAKGMRNAEPQEIARATAALIERPQPYVRVTRAAGSMVAAMKFVPEKIATRLGAILGTDTVFLDRVDTAARHAYLERVSRS